MVSKKLTTRKNVIYRKFQPASGEWPSDDCLSLCASALAKRGESGQILYDDWLARRFPAWGIQNHYRFTHQLVQADSSLFGMLCQYSPNEYMAMVREEKQKREDGEAHISLEEALKQVEVAESKPSAGQHYLKGHAYFLIRGAHLFIVQHTNLRADSLEQYLHDLLRETGTIGADQSFILDGVLSLSKDGRELGGITAVEVGGVLARTISAQPQSEAGAPITFDAVESKEIMRAKSAKSKGKEILDLLFGATQADEIMNIVPAEAELEVDVRFGYKTTKKKISRDALAEIASAARDLPEGQVRAIGRDGKATGNDLRLQTEMPFRRLRENGTLLDAEHAREQLLKVYSRFVEDDKIEA